MKRRKGKKKKKSTAYDMLSKADLIKKIILFRYLVCYKHIFVKDR